MDFKFPHRKLKTNYYIIYRAVAHKIIVKNFDAFFKVVQGSSGVSHLVVFHINTFILITLRCVYIYRERSIIIVDTRSMVIAISIFDTLAFLSSGSGEISCNIRTHRHANHDFTEEYTNEHAHNYSVRRLCTIQHTRAIRQTSYRTIHVIYIKKNAVISTKSERERLLLPKIMFNKTIFQTSSLQKHVLNNLTT